MDQRFGVTLEREERFQFSVRFDGPASPTLVMDEPVPLGNGAGPNATRILGAAIGHCLSASLLFCLEKAKIQVGTVYTTVEGTVVRNAAGRLRIGRIGVTLAPEVPGDAARIQRCLDLFEDFCVVTQSVRQGIDVEVNVTQ